MRQDTGHAQTHTAEQKESLLITRRQKLQPALLTFNLRSVR